MKLTLCLLLIVLSTTTAEADTMKFKSNQTMNGLVTYHSDRFIIEANYKDSGPMRYEFERKYVRSVEINDSVTNQGSPPNWIQEYLYKDRSGKGLSVTLEPSPSMPPSSDEPHTRLSGLPPGMRPTSKSPDDAPEPMSSLVDEKGRVGTSRIKYVDKIVLNGKKGSRVGKLIFITSELIKLAEDKSEISLKRSEVHTIIVGH